MASITRPNTREAAPAQASGQMAFISQVLMMTRRSLVILGRKPETFVPSIFTTIFFLLIFDAALGDAAGFLPAFNGVDYIAFTLPLSIISAALNSPAGQAMVRDIETGYFDKLLLTPIRREALVLGHILSGALIVSVIAGAVTLVAVLLGLRPASGVGGVLVLMGFAAFIAAGFGGLTVGVALRTGNSAAVQGASFAFFPLTFLTTAFFPLDFLGGWLKTAAQINPVTYILDPMRTLMISGYAEADLAVGFAAAALVSVLPFAFAMTSLRARARRR